MAVSSTTSCRFKALQLLGVGIPGVYEFDFRVYILFVPWPFGDTRTASIIELKKWENEDSGR